ncbi:MAG: hypothetical protein C4523_15880 [Myxococcales bacterium]|nr:MAG: hypothetical protein C4523_15880 [Myxococcales bacterium]
MSEFTFKMPPGGIEPCGPGELVYEFSMEKITVQFQQDGRRHGPKLEFSPGGDGGTWLEPEKKPEPYQSGDFQKWHDDRIKRLRHFGKHFKA